jgi:hypothetical protein
VVSEETMAVMSSPEPMPVDVMSPAPVAAALLVGVLVVVLELVGSTELIAYVPRFWAIYRRQSPELKQAPYQLTEKKRAGRAGPE